MAVHFGWELSIGTWAARMALLPAAHERPHLQVGYMAGNQQRQSSRTPCHGEPSIHGPNFADSGQV